MEQDNDIIWPFKNKQNTACCALFAITDGGKTSAIFQLARRLAGQYTKLFMFTPATFKMDDFQRQFDTKIFDQKTINSSGFMERFYTYMDTNKQKTGKMDQSEIDAENLKRRKENYLIMQSNERIRAINQQRYTKTLHKNLLLKERPLIPLLHMAKVSYICIFDDIKFNHQSREQFIIMCKMCSHIDMVSFITSQDLCVTIQRGERNLQHVYYFGGLLSSQRINQTVWEMLPEVDREELKQMYKQSTGNEPHKFFVVQKKGFRLLCYQNIIDKKGFFHIDILKDSQNDY